MGKAAPIGVDVDGVASDEDEDEQVAIDDLGRGCEGCTCGALSRRDILKSVGEQRCERDPRDEERQSGSESEGGTSPGGEKLFLRDF